MPLSPEERDAAFEQGRQEGMEAGRAALRHALTAMGRADVAASFDEWLNAHGTTDKAGMIQFILDRHGMAGLAAIEEAAPAIDDSANERLRDEGAFN